jgi:hypothetical protein
VFCATAGDAVTPDPHSSSEYKRHLAMWKQRALDAEARLEALGESPGDVIRPKPLTAAEWLRVAEASDNTVLGMKAMAHRAWLLAAETRRAQTRPVVVPSPPQWPVVEIDRFPHACPGPGCAVCRFLSRPQ